MAGGQPDGLRGGQVGVHQAARGGATTARDGMQGASLLACGPPSLPCRAFSQAGAPLLLPPPHLGCHFCLAPPPRRGGTRPCHLDARPPRTWNLASASAATTAAAAALPGSTYPLGRPMDSVAPSSWTCSVGGGCPRLGGAGVESAARGSCVAPGRPAGGAPGQGPQAWQQHLHAPRMSARHRQQHKGYGARVDGASARTPTCPLSCSEAVAISAVRSSTNAYLPSVCTLTVTTGSAPAQKARWEGQQQRPHQPGQLGQQ